MYVRLFGRLKGMTVSAVVFDSAACPQFHGCAHKFVELHISILGCIKSDLLVREWDLAKRWVPVPGGLYRCRWVCWW